MRHQNAFVFCLFLPVMLSAQSVQLHSADPVSMPSRADCNSPGFWSDSQLSIFVYACTRTGSHMDFTFMNSILITGLRWRKRSSRKQPKYARSIIRKLLKAAPLEEGSFVQVSIRAAGRNGQRE